MILDLFLFLMFFAPIAALLFVLYKVSGLEELVKNWLASRKRLRQSMWELQQTEDIIGIMYDEGTLDKMTTVQRKELIKLLAKEYPLWYEVYGKHYNA